MSDTNKLNHIAIEALTASLEELIAAKELLLIAFGEVLEEGLEIKKVIKVIEMNIERHKPKPVIQ